MKILEHIFEYFSKPHETFWRLAILILTSVSVTFIMTTLVSQMVEPVSVKVDEVARRSVVAPSDFTVEDATRRDIEPVLYHVHRGEVIVRAGNLIDDIAHLKLARLAELRSTGGSFRIAFGYVLLTVFILLTVFAFTSLAWPHFKPSTRDLMFMSATLIGSFVVIQAFSVLGRSLNLSFPDISPGVFLLAAPLAAGGILLEVTLSAASGFLFLTCFALLTGVFLEDSWELILLIMLGNMIGMLSVSKCCRRATFIVAGSKVALANMAIVSVFLFVEPHFTLADNASRVMLVILGGLSSGILGAGLAPIAEYFGSYVTDIKLLELGSIDHPLLGELSVQAPGTWNHSMVIGQMGEAAAEAIGAQSLLTRVGAYYHDIGKTKKPPYFAENQCDGDNRHDKLTPSMSALIIRTHVKDGVEMARHHRMPKAIIDIIEQHHGTALIEYFYQKALDNAAEGDGVDDARYRYPGPKPQTRESGILMLADAIEASSRTLTAPSHAKIQGLVQKRINKVFASGQLDESELTLKDLHVIAKSFTRVLSGIYHRRVEYSEPADKRSRNSSSESRSRGEEKKLHSNVTKHKVSGEHKGHECRPADEGNDKERVNKLLAEKADSGSNAETLKRLGM